VVRLRLDVLRRSYPLALIVALAACGGRRPLPEADVPPIECACEDAPGIDRRTPATTSPVPTWDLTVILPYDGPEQTPTFTVTASAGRVDVHMLIDTTGSFNGEIIELQRALLTTVIPGLRSRIQSVTTGVSAFQDMPFEPFGASSDVPFRLLTAQTTDYASVAAGVRRLNNPLGMGGDRPEGWIEGLYQVATGMGLSVGGRVLVPPFQRQNLPDTGTVGGVGFRANSTRVVVLVTDAPPHDAMEYGATVPTAHSWAQTQSALRTLGARVVGIASAPDARNNLEIVATATGAVASPIGGRCETGLNGTTRAPVSGMCPLVYEIAPDGTGLSRTIVDSIARLLDAAVFREAHGTSQDDTQGFLRAIEAASAVPALMSPAPGREDRLPAGMLDGVSDTFTSVYSRTQLTFRLHLQNRSVIEGEFPQVFFLRVLVTGDGTILREVTVRVIVPEGPKDGGRDGSRDAVGEGGGEGGAEEAGLDGGALDGSITDDAGGDAGGDASDDLAADGADDTAAD